MSRARYILDFEWALGLSEPWVKGIFMAVFSAVLVFSLIQDKDHIYEGAPDRAKWRDLRLWAAAILVLQAGIYWLL